MKTLFTSFLFLCSGILSTVAQEKDTVTLTIEVSATKYDKGSILLALYNSEKDYMKTDYKSASVTIKDKKATIVFKDIDKGSYAFSLFHDINDNQKLDTNFIGIPKEPYAFSNNEKGSFGPPKFKKVMFNVHQDQHIKVNIK